MTTPTPPRNMDYLHTLKTGYAQLPDEKGIFRGPAASAHARGEPGQHAAGAQNPIGGLTSPIVSSSPLILAGAGGDHGPALARSMATTTFAELDQIRPRQALTEPGASRLLCFAGRLDSNFGGYLSRHPLARIVVFWESPATALTTAVRSAGALEARVVLDQWVGSVSPVLKLWRQHRRQISLASWEECATSPQIVAGWLSQMLGSPVARASDPAAPPADSFAVKLLAMDVARQHREASRLWNEMLAASQPLAPAPAGTESEAEAALVAALEQEFALVHGEREQRRLTACLEAAEAATAEAHKDLLRLRETEARLSSELEMLHHRHSQTCGRLLQEIRRAHQESESFFERWKIQEATTHPIHLQAAHLVRGNEENRPPHRHLDYTLEGVTLLDRHWAHLRARLVEHNGNAGLAIFDCPAHGEHPLYRWEPDGTEGGMAFMLFVPREKRAAARLQSAPTSDLLFLRGLAGQILGHLSTYQETLPDHWIIVARRLLQEIDEIPERLHYDSVAGSLHRENNRSLVRFEAANLYFRGHCASSLAVDWAPDSSGGTLLLEAGKADTAILLTSAAELSVAFASARNKESTGETWAHLTAHERAFLLLLVKALPDFVSHLCGQRADQKPDKERLTRQARKLYRQLRHLDRRQQLRNTITKLVRR